MSQENTRSLRVALVYPPTTNAVQSLFTFHRNVGIGFKPPLGIMILATYLRANGFPETSCLDAQVEELTPERTAARLAEMRPDVVGLTAWTDFWYPVWKTAQCVRKALPNCTIVMGGPHCMVYPEESLLGSEADYIVAGDGEDTLLGLVTALSEGRPVDDLPGLWRKEQGRAVPPAEKMSVIKDLSKIPAPDRTLLPVTRYYSVLNPHDYETTMITSRGCPHKCVFCKMHAQRVYARSAGQVIEEFKDIAALGIKDVQVYDDTFTWSKERVMDICRGILDHGLKVNWAIRDRVNRADRELYALMRKAGCYRIHYGVESGSPEVLAASGKGITLDQVKNAVAMAKGLGFDTLAFYMFGFLDETREDAMRTIRFAISLDTDYAVFAAIIPYPGTRLYDMALERGIIPRDFWRDFTLSPAPDYRIPHLIEQEMDRDTLIHFKNMALRKYYFRPKPFFRELFNVGSFKDFTHKANMAMNILSDNARPLVDKIMGRADKGVG
jgi:radical SAM superfamily enzyme YgiQ (UPF0313 family)